VQGAYRIHVPNVLCTMSPWDGFSRIPVFITVLGSVLLDDGWAHPSVFRFLIAFWVMCHKVSWSSFFSWSPLMWQYYNGKQFYMYMPHCQYKKKSDACYFLWCIWSSLSFYPHFSVIASFATFVRNTLANRSLPIPLLYHLQ
jgi:hypothetical protein